jgi:CRISPR-associated endonuclease/helicase Cas3
LGIAHIHPKTGKEQSVAEHVRTVAAFSEEFAAKIGLGRMGRLIGLLHDLGKEKQQFEEYICHCYRHPEDKTGRGSVNHSTAGARLIYEQYFHSKDPYAKLTAQLIALIVGSHHGGLIDCIDLNGLDLFTQKMETEEDICYEESIRNYTQNCASLKEIDDLFVKATEEIKRVYLKIMCAETSTMPQDRGRNQKCLQFALGMLVKYLFSCLIDADRYDTYLFMEDKRPTDSMDIQKQWEKLILTMEAGLEGLPQGGRLEALRKEISLGCKIAAQRAPGIYRLSVPTGGGKTFSSMRYSLEHAFRFKKRRIFYIVNYITIIEQNAQDIRELLGLEGCDILLEHHSNLVNDNKNEDYKLLTERYENLIVFTTMVQFLNTLFAGGTQDVRRLHTLADSVIILDEVQTLPIKCINMFNSAMNFLTEICGATIVLCTATQPLLEITDMPLRISPQSQLIPGLEDRFKDFKRVELVDKTRPERYTVSDLKDFVLERLRAPEESIHSLLTVLNTKKDARLLFQELVKLNKELLLEEQYMIYHLSTSMCPAHRTETLKVIKEKMEEIRNGKISQKMICTSTALIEAGVNISFDCVVRAHTGFDSLVQAAGRCNRHQEVPCRKAYVVNMKDESITWLEDIKKGQYQTERLLREFQDDPGEFDGDMLSPKLIETYYSYYYHERKTDMDYTLKTTEATRKKKTLYNLLSNNPDGQEAYRGRQGQPPLLDVKQAFKTAGKEFRVIDQDTIGVLVPHKRGKELIALLNGQCSLTQMKEYLQEAQQYSVNLFKYEWDILAGIGAFIPLKNGGILAVREEFYDPALGISFEARLMDFYHH